MLTVLLNLKRHKVTKNALMHNCTHILIPFFIKQIYFFFYFNFSHRFYEMDEIGGKKNENLRNAVPFVRQITQDGKPKLEVYRPTTNPIYIYTQVS